MTEKLRGGGTDADPSHTSGHVWVVRFTYKNKGSGRSFWAHILPSFLVSLRAKLPFLAAATAASFLVSLMAKLPFLAAATAASFLVSLMAKLPFLAAATAAAVAQGAKDDAALYLGAYLLFLAAVAHIFESMWAPGGRAGHGVALLVLLPFPLFKFGTAVRILSSSSSSVTFPLGQFMLFIVLSLVALQVPGDASADRARRLFEKLHFLTAAAFFMSYPVGGKAADPRLASFDVLVLFLAGVAVMFVRLGGFPATRARSGALVALLPFLLIRLGAAGSFSASCLIYRMKADALIIYAVLLFQRVCLAGGTTGGEPQDP